MKHECENCNSCEIDSLLIEYEGKRICRKCQIMHPQLTVSFWGCSCTSWKIEQLKEMVQTTGVQPKCDSCDKAILRHPYRGEVDKVNHPTHYQSEKFEVIDIIEEFSLNFNLGNVIK